MPRVDASTIAQIEDSMELVKTGKELADSEFTVGTCFKLIDILIEQGKFNEAIEIAQHLFDRRGDPKDLVKLSTAIYKSRDREKLAAITKTIEDYLLSNPANPQVIHRLVVNYRVFDRDLDSLNILEKHISKTEFLNYPPIVTDYGDFLNRRGTYDIFVSFYDNLPATTKNVDRVKKEYASSLIRLGKLKEAESALASCSKDKMYNNLRFELDKLKKQAGFERHSTIKPESNIPDHIVFFANKVKEEHVSAEKVCFVIMKFEDTDLHNRILTCIRTVLSKFNIVGLRADDKEYSDDLNINVLAHIYACDFAVAVFERLSAEEFNPNVSFEVGYLQGLHKNVCLLKDKTLKHLHTDLIGKLYKNFDTQHPETTIPEQLEKWLKDKEIIKPNILKPTSA